MDNTQFNSLITQLDISGVATKFNKVEDLIPLRNLLIDVFDLNKKDKEKLAERFDEFKIEYTKDGKKRSSLLGLIYNDLGSYKNTLKSISDTLSAMAAGDWKTWVYKGVKLAASAAELWLDAVKDYYGNLKELRDAGVIIKEGFSETFGIYALNARMSQQEFSKLLISNNRFIARMTNASSNITSSTMLISNMVRSLNGKYGLDDNQVSTIITFFTGLTNTMSRRKMIDTELTNQAEQLGAAMKGLANATGMSIEQLKEKIKMDEQDLVERRILQDPKRRLRYLTNKALMGKDAAIFSETGIPNDKVIQMLGHPLQREFLTRAMGITQRTGGTKEDISKMLGEYEKLSAHFIDPLREEFSNLDVRFTQLAAGGWLENNYALTGFTDAVKELNDKGLDEFDPENKILKGMNLLNKTTQIIKDLLIYQFTGNLGDEMFSNVMGSLANGGENLLDVLMGKDKMELIYDKINLKKASVDLNTYEKNKNKGLSNYTSDEKRSLAINKMIGDSVKVLKYKLTTGSTINEYNEFAKKYGFLTAILNDKNEIEFDSLHDMKWMHDINQTQATNNNYIATMGSEGVGLAALNSVTDYYRTKKETKKPEYSNTITLSEKDQEVLQKLLKAAEKTANNTKESNDTAKSNAAEHYRDNSQGGLN